MAKWAFGCVILLLVVVVLGGLYIAGIFNGLVAAEEAVNEKWAQVQNVYQRRADLVPNLVETVKGASEFERETLESVVEARSRVGQVQLDAGPEMLADPAAFARYQQAQDALGSALQRLLVVVERYPELKSVEAFRDLMVQLEGTENRIAVERMRYNQEARDFNTLRKRVPARWWISLLGWGFEEKSYFSAQEGAEQVPVVEF